MRLFAPFTRLFGRSSRSDVSARLDHATAAIFRRLNLLENNMDASFADLNTKLNTKVDRIAALLDAKTATVDDHATELAALKTEQASDIDQLNQLDTKLDAIIARHDTPAPAAITTTIDPVTGLPTT